MRLATAVIGFVPNEIAELLANEASYPQVVDVRIERGSDELIVRIRREDIDAVRLGSTMEDETGVQIILKRAEFETITRGRPSGLGLEEIRDPLLRRLTATAIASSIYV